MESSLFTEYLLWKALGICVLGFVVSMVYRVVTGRSITQARSGAAREEARSPKQEDAAP